MSQTGPASHHDSRRSSRSLPGDDQTSPSSTRFGQFGTHDVRREASSLPYPDKESKGQQVSSRTSAVHNILNPPEARPGVAGGHNVLPSISRPLHNEALTTATGSGLGHHHATRPFSLGQPASISLPGTPVGPVTPLGGSTSAHNSPTLAFPFPAINNPRTRLSPRPMPRTTTLSHGPSSIAHSVSPAKRSYESDVAEEPKLQYSGLQYAPGVPPGPINTTATARPLSQPAISSPATHGPPLTIPHNNPSGHQHPSASPVQVQFSSTAPPSRHFPAVASPDEVASSSWSDMMRRHGMGGAIVGAEGQQAFMTLPGSDTPIAVQVDYSQASKKADEKRQRNAVASTRHRRKKKILQEENSKQIQDLQDEKRQLELQFEELTRQRDFYRDDRNRLWDIVASTPSISSHATGPRSPNFTRSLSFAERDASIGRTRPSISTQMYGSDTSGERPAQRRRTSDRPDFAMPVYESPAGMHPGASPGGLPPMQGHGYGVPSRPSSAASSTGGERLPSLRSMEEVPLPSSGPGQVHEQNPKTGQWAPVQPRATEMGWATRGLHRRF